MTTESLALDSPTTLARIPRGTDDLGREARGWRSGKPFEDPDKVKRWGFVTAKPSEYLIHVRRGAITARSGQGASCFKWPWDSVAIVPTSLQRLGFCADQVTAEKVGVEVVGLAVYRIADPKLAFRVLNFSYPERAQQKLEHTLTAMFVGATRRIVATLAVEDCLRKRKAALAEELLREISPVVGGSGRPDDVTQRGWGVVIDTIEIQEVRVLSGSVFAAMQAPYRAQLDQQAREARALADRAIAERLARCRQETELAQLEVETALATEQAAAAREQHEQSARDQRRRAELEQQRAQQLLDDEVALTRKRLEQEAALESERAAIAQRQLEESATRAVRAAELSAQRAEAEAAACPARGQAQEQQGDLDRRQAALEAELVRRGAEARRDQGLAEAEVALALAQAQQRRSEADAQLELARQLPALAAAMGERMGAIHVTQIGGEAEPLAQVTGGLMALVELARQIARSGRPPSDE